MKLIASTITKPNGRGRISADIIPPARSSRFTWPGRARAIPLPAVLGPGTWGSQGKGNFLKAQ